jgi:DNA processing protein
LLKQGATLVTEAEDVIAVLRPILERELQTPMEEPETPEEIPLLEPHETERARVIGLLGATPAGIDDLVRLSGSSPAVVRTVLLELEIAGRLERHGGGFFSLLG